jgi:hypothetical protein
MYVELRSREIPSWRQVCQAPKCDIGRQLIRLHRRKSKSEHVISTVECPDFAFAFFDILYLLYFIFRRFLRN